MTTKELRRYAWILTAATAAVGSFWLWKGHPVGARVLYGVSGYALLSSFIYPRAVWPIRRLLMAVGHGVTWLTTRLILALTYYLVITPIGLLLRVFGKDALQRKIDPDADSYWIERKPEPFDRERYEKQF